MIGIVDRGVLRCPPCCLHNVFLIKLLFSHCLSSRSITHVLLVIIRFNICNVPDGLADLLELSLILIGDALEEDERVGGQRDDDLESRPKNPVPITLAHSAGNNTFHDDIEGGYDAIDGGSCHIGLSRQVHHEDVGHDLIELVEKDYIADFLGVAQVLHRKKCIRKGAFEENKLFSKEE